MGLTAYLYIELSSIEPVLSSHWFTPKPLSLFLNHFNSLSPSTRTCLCESPTRHSSFVFLCYRDSIPDTDSIQP